MQKTIGLLIVVVLVGISYQGKSQKYKNKEMSLTSFSISIHPEIRQFLDKLQSHFSPCKNPKADKIISALKEQTWTSLSDRLQNEVNMIILPLNTYGEKFDYDDYGFPDATISKAIKKGASKFYMKLELIIWIDQYSTSANKYQNDSLIKPIVLTEGQIRPKITLNITTYSENGVLPIGKYTGIAIAPKAFDVSPSVLDGLINANDKTDLTTFMSLIDEAISELIINIYAQ